MGLFDGTNALGNAITSIGQLGFKVVQQKEATRAAKANAKAAQAAAQQAKYEADAAASASLPAPSFFSPVAPATAESPVDKRLLYGGLLLLGGALLLKRRR